jgi:hypothetical protein
MSTATEPEVEPKLDDAPPCWPPVSHIIRNEDKPAKPGTIALCGAKLMGIDLGRLKDANSTLCPKCVEALKRYLGRP